MHTASHCQSRALLLLQVAEECPRLKEQAEFIASEWLFIADLRISLAKIRQIEDASVGGLIARADTDTLDDDHSSSRILASSKS
jgi:hypothetical protein